MSTFPPQLRVEDLREDARTEHSRVDLSRSSVLEFGVTTAFTGSHVSYICFLERKALKRLAERLFPSSSSLEWTGEYCNERIVEDVAGSICGAEGCDAHSTFFLISNYRLVS